MPINYFSLSATGSNDATAYDYEFAYETWDFPLFGWAPWEFVYGLGALLFLFATSFVLNGAWFWAIDS